MGIADRLAKLIDDRDAPGGTDFETRVSLSNDNQVEKYFIGLSAGNVAQLFDDDITAGAMPTSMGTLLSRLQQHYNEIGGTGYASLAAALATRGTRWHRKLAGMASSYAIPAKWQFDDEVSLGTFAYGGSFVPGSNLNDAVESNRVVCEVGVDGIGLAVWDLTVTAILGEPTTTLSAAITDVITSIALSSATSFPSAGCIQIDSEQIDYTDKTGDTLTGCTRGANGTANVAHSSGAAVYGVEDVAVSMTNGLPEGAQVTVSGLGVTDRSLEGQAVVLMSSTTGYAAGQEVLIVDNEYGVKVAADAAAAQADITVAEADAYLPGDAITIRDSAATENLTILRINYETDVITCTTNLVSAYTVAQGAMIYRQTGAGVGWTEKGTVSDVSTDVSITLTTALKHSYYDNADVYRLYRDVTAVATSSGGTDGDDVIVKALPDRVIAL